MARHLGLGPVFAFEWLMTSRRWQSYAMRSLTVGLLLAAMVLVWSESRSAFSGEISIQEQARVGRTFYGVTSTLLLGLVGLAAPAATAGSICLDKARGNLTLLFATDLSDREIVLGKLAARLVPVLGLILCASPVLAIATLFGGIDPVQLTGTILVLLSCAVFGCSLALTLSVWGRKTHEVLMATYVFGILYLLAAPLLEVFRNTLPLGWWPAWIPPFLQLLRYNPVFLVIATVEQPPGMPVTLATNAAFFGLGLAASAALLALSTWRIRAVTVHQLGQAERAPRRFWGPRRSRSRARADRPPPPARRLDPGPIDRAFPTFVRYTRLVRWFWPSPSLDRNPVLWRECQRRRMSAWNLAIWGVYILLCGGFSLWAIGLIFLDSGRRASMGREIGSVVNAMQVAAGLLMLSVSSSTSLAEERQRGSLDVIMATPLPTRSIVWGKWWGAFRSVPPLLILPLAVSLAMVWDNGKFWVPPILAGLILSYGAAITSLGLALATWISRQGRAVGLSVGLYTFFCIGWIPLSYVLFGGPGDEGIGIASASPIMGVGVFTGLASEQRGWNSDLASQTLWVLFWTVANLAVAVGLLLSTFVTFNRCLGRVDEPELFDEEDFLPADPPPNRDAPSPHPSPAPANSVGPDA